MQNMKRTLSLIVALAMCLSLMSIPAFAALDEDDTPATAEEINEIFAAGPEEETEEAPEEDAEPVEDTEETSDDDAEAVEETEETSDEDAEAVEETEETSDAAAAEAVEETEEASDDDAEPVEDAEETSDDDAKVVEETEEAPAIELKPVGAEELEEALEQLAKEIAEAEEKAQLPELFPAYGYTASRVAGGYAVTVTVEAESFEEDAAFRVLALDWAELDDATAELLKANGLTEADALLDIGFINADAEEIEPLKPVAVSIEAEEQIAEVYHVEDAETVTLVAEDVGDAVAEFVVEGFSYYVLKAGATDSEDKIKSDDTKYETLEAAFSSVPSGGTVTLLSDIKISGDLNRTQYHNIMIDGNGHTITLSDNVTVGSGYWLFLKDVAVDLNGYTFTAADNAVRFNAGTTTVKDSSENKTGKVVGGWWIGGTAVVNIEGGNFGTFGTGGNVNFFGGTVDKLDNGNYSVKIAGGTFKSLNGKNIANYVPQYGYGCYDVTENDGVYTVAHNSVTADTTVNGIDYVYVAKVGDTSYGTLAEAVAAVKTAQGGTIELLRDVLVTDNFNTGGIALTLNGNDHTITANGTDSLFQSNNITVNGVTFAGSAPRFIYRVGGTAVLTNVNASSTANFAINFYGGGTAELTNCNITGTVANDRYSAANIWVGDGATLTVNSGTYGSIFVNASNGAGLNAGNIVVNGGTIDTLKLELEKNKKEETFGTVTYDVESAYKSASLTMTGGYIGTLVTNPQEIDTTSLTNIGVSKYVNITGGTFSTQPDSSYLAGGYAAYQTVGASTYTVRPTAGYTVTWQNWNGATLETDEHVAYGATPTYNGSTPTRPDSGSYYYVFSAWSPAVSAVTGDVTYTAQFSQYEYSYYDDPAPVVTQPQQPATVEIEEEATPLAALPASLSDVTVTITNETGETVEVAVSDLPVPFADVDENSWARDAIAYANALGLMNGVGDDENGEASFNPQGTTTSEMLTTVLFRAVSGEETSGENWAEDALAWAADANLTEGIGLEEGKEVTREQMVTMMYRVAAAKGFDVAATADLTGFKDADDLSDFARAAMEWAVSVGLINGMDGGLNASGSVTREQIATILMRFNEMTKDVV